LEGTLTRVTCWRRPSLEFLKVLLSLFVGKTLDLDYVGDIGILAMSIGWFEVKALGSGKDSSFGLVDSIGWWFSHSSKREI
jgi:hypothetical protein